MLFSVVIPVYNVEKYLHECVDSVLGQTFGDFEVILVNDGSKDSSPAICDGYADKDKRVKVIHKPNSGQSDARNAGIDAAKGEYVICLDSDDYYANNEVFAKIAEKIKSNPDVVLFGFRKIYESDGSYGDSILPRLENKSDAITSLRELLINDTYGGSAWTKAIKINLLRDHSIHFRSGMISEDIDWYLHVLCHVKSFECLSEPFVVYRQRSGSITHTLKLNSLTDNLWILETWPRLIKNSQIEPKMKEMLMSTLAYYYATLLILYTSYDSQIRKEYRQRVKNLRFLFDYAISKRAIIIRMFVKIIGFDSTLYLLGWLNKKMKH